MTERDWDFLYYQDEDMKPVDYLFFVLLGAAWILTLATGLFMMTAVIFL